MRYIIMLWAILGLLINLSAQSNAHKKSAFAIGDPMYSIEKKLPASNLKTTGATWLYGPAELESWRLQKLIEDTKTAKLDVGYPGTMHTAYTNGSFRLKLNGRKATGKISFRAVGQGQVLVNDSIILQFNTGNAFRMIPIPQNKAIKELRFEISTLAEPPALLIENGSFSTENKNWEWKSDHERWQPAFHFAQTISNVPPHQVESPEVILKPESRKGNLHDFGREIFGYVMIRRTKCPKISVGESKNEALDTIYKPLEQSLEMVQAGNGFWKSKSALAFRYILANVKSSHDIHCSAQFYPVSYKGAFACSDTLLTRIWMNSAYTLRLCMHDFLVDGVKRDRLPWAGDLAMSMMADAYAFGDREIVRRSLTVLGRPGIEKTDVNGIIDYSLWWIISQEHYQLYFGDANHLKREWPRIKETLDRLKARCDTSGFISTKNTWLFIDWVNQEKWTAVQILWWWAQECGTKLANRVGDTSAAIQWQKSSQILKDKLTKVAWSNTKKGWLANPVFPDKMTRHANFLAVISGLATEDQFDGIGRILSGDEVSPVGTPYMAGFEDIAIARLGNIQTMLNRTRRYWGGMLSQGATTFWEGYATNQSGKDLYEFYKRPYGKSLCHAWSAGPAAFLPSEILGLHPLEDGWKRFSVNPKPGTLKWVSSTTPTPYGNIIIDIIGQTMNLNVPAGTIAEWKGKQIRGPRIITDNL